MTQLKLFDPFPRAVGTSLKQFSAHWTTVHAEIAREIPQIRHYVQSHRIANVPSSLGFPFEACWCDGSSETWYDNIDDFRTMLEEPGIERLLEDETNFMDLTAPRSPVLTHEHLIDAGKLDPQQHGIKVLQFVRRKNGLSRAEFIDAWIRDNDAATGRALGATRHIACAAVDDSYDLGHPDASVFDTSRRAPYDGVRELWWPDESSLAQAARQNPTAWRRLLHSDATDVARSFALCATERVILI